ncbi:TetR/AcrR family transcriptional regulator [Cryobacterium luteum]|uniref:TetR/AcrR family transcriptional regulator n=1 Tax=Cryobacterium luteum TaxID=1424661 RepID=A0A1H8L1W1_9MICO|nr:TetR/AcrR family transcriptional regulator [Cryobacterium luteum]TFB82356.1 TetR/AcrR family transcriptional regulator [Cryobacterium luteum]SEN99081.1 transcriptional regulator, TetR family [Cryobacterium luteum]
MGRPRQFDERQAVADACQVFWAKGFDGTSTADLCEAMGLNRSSLYNTFLSKEQLFRLSLVHYIAATTARQDKFLEVPGKSGLERLRILLTAIAEDEIASRATGNGFGCFIVNTITSIAARNAEIAHLIDADLQKRIAALSAAVQIGQTDGSINKERDPRETAWYITTVISGMRVSAQSGANKRILDALAEIALHALAN